MKLSDAFNVPDSVLGYLEWSSGILYINATYDEFQAALDRKMGSPPPLRIQQLLQTISHESYHFAQVVTTGFFFRFACRALNCVSAILKPPLDDARIQHLLASPPKQSKDYINLIAPLDKHSGDYLTDRAVIESSTMFFEHREHLAGLNHEGYLELLRKEMPDASSEYRLGYELATNAIGDRAFDSILPISFIALCFESPRDAFKSALDSIRANGAPSEWTLATVQQVAAAVSSSQQPIGSAIEVMEQGSSHPIYSPVVMALNDNCEKVNPIEMMVRPQQNTVDTYLPIVRPTLFRNGVLHVPTAFSDHYPGASASDAVQAIAILAAIAMRIGTKGESVSRYRVIA